MKTLKNNKGFIAISIIYSFFVLFIIVMLLIIYSYVSDRKAASRIKSDITNEFKVKAPVISINPTGSDNQSSSSYTVRISVADSGAGINSIGYAWSTTPKYTTSLSLTAVSNNTDVTSPTAAGKYYLIVKACDVDNNCQTLISHRFVVGS